jgi:hypothetical protein
MTLLTTPTYNTSWVISRYLEDPHGDDRVKWYLLNQINIEIRDDIEVIWIRLSNDVDFKTVTFLLTTNEREELERLLPNSLFHSYCVFVRHDQCRFKIRGGLRCDSPPETLTTQP